MNLPQVSNTVSVFRWGVEETLFLFMVLHDKIYLLVFDEYTQFQQGYWTQLSPVFGNESEECPL